MYILNISDGNQYDSRSLSGLRPGRPNVKSKKYKDKKMSKFTILNESIFQYLLNHQSDISKPLRDLINLTAQHPLGFMGTPENQISFMVLLAKLIQAKNIIEIGIFTGATSLALAETLPSDGKLIACDIRDEFTKLGEPYWEAAGVKNKINLKLAPAADTLKKLLLDGQAGKFDLVYIDADKGGYIQYIDLALELVRSGGLVLADNALRSGQVADLENQEKTTRQLRDFNSHIKKLNNVFFNLLPIGDGLMMILKN